MIGKLNKVKGQRGFSMAEVVVAVTLFVASILGVSVMLVSGGANVTRGAKDSTAANLAAKKIEEVKSLRWYVPWGGTNADIDDTYFNTFYSNANQLSHPAVTEDYGTIPGYSSYRRTTSIQYQYASSISASQPAVMYSNWVPKAPTGSQTDRPKGGTLATDTASLHYMIVEVRTYYRDSNGAEKPYAESGLIGDTMITGGTNRPVLVITSIDPSQGYYGDTLSMHVFVDAEGLTPATSQVSVSLWRPGYNDIPATVSTVYSSGQINATFELWDHPAAIPLPYTVRAGTYSIAVYWQDRGFDAKFRDCFLVNVPPPTITGITSYNWGYRAQTARRVTITGNNLGNGMVTMKGRSPWDAYICPGAVVSSNVNTIVADFNLALLPAGTNNTRWDFQVTTDGGTDLSSGDPERFLLNPPPAVTGISTWPVNSYTGTKVSNSLSGIGISGTYLQNYPSLPTVYIIQSNGGAPTNGQVYQQLTGGSVPDDGTSDTSMSANVSVNPMNFRIWGGGTPTNAQVGSQGSSPNNYGRYYVYLINADGQIAPVTSYFKDITHKRYTYAVSAKQPTWATVTGGGTWWQDEANVTLTATATATSNMFLAWDEYNGSTWTQTSTSNPWPLGAATTDKTYRCRYRKKLYYGDDVSPNYAGFSTGYTNSPYDTPNYTNAEGNRYTMKVRSTAGFYNDGGVGVYANVNFTDATTMYIYWRQADGNNNGSSNWAALCYGSSGGNYDNGRYKGTDDVFGWTWESQGVSGWSGSYLHINSYTGYSVLGGNSTDVRVWYLYLE